MMEWFQKALETNIALHYSYQSPVINTFDSLNLHPPTPLIIHPSSSRDEDSLYIDVLPDCDPQDYLQNIHKLKNIIDFQHKVVLGRQIPKHYVPKFPYAPSLVECTKVATANFKSRMLNCFERTLN